MFTKVIGLEGPKQILSCFLTKKIKPPNLIFIGAEGCGKATMAINFAQTVSCQSLNACGICHSCRLFENYQHPDFIIVKPDGISIKISQIHDLQYRILNMPALSAYKVVLIKEAEKLGLEASNAFLKTFEEIKDNCLVILSVSSEKEILPTILSRGLKIYFPIPTAQNLDLILKTKFNWDDSQLDGYKALFKYGIKGDLLKNWSDFTQLRAKVIAMVDDCSNQDFFKILLQLPSVSNQNQASLALSIMFSWFRDLIMIKNGYLEGIINQDYQMSLVKSQWLGLSLEELCELSLLISQSLSAVNRQANRALSVAAIFVRLKKLLAVLADRSFANNIANPGYNRLLS